MFRVTPDSWLRRVIVTPGSAPPCSSRTTPSMRPVGPCANADTCRRQAPSARAVRPLTSERRVVIFLLRKHLASWLRCGDDTVWWVPDKSEVLIAPERLYRAGPNVVWCETDS